MTGFTWSLVLNAAIAAMPSHQYRDALQVADTTGRPLLILVGADWCPHCQVMKRATMPGLEKSGELGGVAFAVVDTTRQKHLADALTKGGAIPQLILFRKTPDGWRRSQLIGEQTEEAVEAFIRRAIQRQAQAAQPAVR